MKFELRTAKSFYSKHRASQLEGLGFTFEEYSNIPGEPLLMDHTCEVVEVELNTLEELSEFSDKWGNLVFSRGAITIYDDYLE